jgi:hypothetical protein
MHRKSIRAARLFAAPIGLSIYAPDAVLAQGPCAQILIACEQAGFVRGGARAGNGLQVDCVRPIMGGESQRRQASKPLPHVDAQLVSTSRPRTRPTSSCQTPPEVASGAFPGQGLVRDIGHFGERVCRPAAALHQIRWIG